MKANDFDFSGWATKNDIRCKDGRTIRHNAFIKNDGTKVPLVWNHCHNNNDNVLGHAILENRDEGVYAYCYLNDTPAGLRAKSQIMHHDIDALSIYANELEHEGSNVMHGVIREVSLVLAGANPGALIDTESIAMAHGYDNQGDEEAVIYTNETIEIAHAATNNDKPETDKPEKEQNMDEKKTVGEVLDTLNEEQKVAVYAVIAQIAKDQKDSEGGKEGMAKHNLFDEENEDFIAHSIDFSEVAAEAKRCGSFKEAFLAHSDDPEHPDYGTYGFGENTSYLFPDARLINNQPDVIKRDDSWVSKFLNAAKHTPFSRVKSIHANITADDARAKGYVRGNYKAEEVVALLKRSTDPQTIYKKQRMDRDDMIDITSFEVVGWLKGEMRGMLNEELARAGLVGDGRDASSDDKIDPLHIRPIWTDDALYTIQQNVKVSAGATEDAKAKAFIRNAIKARKNYKGSGNPTLFTTEDMLTDMLLLEDNNGRIIYESEAKLATALRVKEIVTVPVMENLSRTKTVDGSSIEVDLMGIIVNPQDYNYGADKGGEVNMFDDFDIDYNQMKYLIETRCSGALVKPYSAIVLELVEGN